METVEINSRILEEIKSSNNIITTQKVQQMGFSRALLSEYVSAGLLVRVRQGVYILSGSVHDDMFTLSLSSQKIVFSHESALFLNGLSERTPFIHSVTIPTGSFLPKSIKDETVCFYIKPEVYEIGLSERKTTFGNSVRCYNTERTICDLLRSKSRIDEETFTSAIKNYAASSEKDLNLLASYAQKFKVFNEAKKYLEVLL